MTEFKLGLPVVLVVAFIIWLWPPIIAVIFFLALGAIAFYAVCRAAGFFLLLFLQWHTCKQAVLRAKMEFTTR